MIRVAIVCSILLMTLKVFNAQVTRNFPGSDDLRSLAALLRVGRNEGQAQGPGETSRNSDRSAGGQIPPGTRFTENGDLQNPLSFRNAMDANPAPQNNPERVLPVPSADTLLNNGDMISQIFIPGRHHLNINNREVSGEFHRNHDRFRIVSGLERPHLHGPDQKRTIQTTDSQDKNRQFQQTIGRSSPKNSLNIRKQRISLLPDLLRPREENRFRFSPLARFLNVMKLNHARGEDSFNPVTSPNSANQARPVNGNPSDSQTFPPSSDPFILADSFFAQQNPTNNFPAREASRIPNFPNFGSVMNIPAPTFNGQSSVEDVMAPDRLPLAGQSLADNLFSLRQKTVNQSKRHEDPSSVHLLPVSLFQKPKPVRSFSEKLPDGPPFIALPPRDQRVFLQPESAFHGVELSQERPVRRNPLFRLPSNFRNFPNEQVSSVIIPPPNKSLTLNENGFPSNSRPPSFFRTTANVFGNRSNNTNFNVVPASRKKDGTSSTWQFFPNLVPKRRQAVEQVSEFREQQRALRPRIPVRQTVQRTFENRWLQKGNNSGSGNAFRSGHFDFSLTAEHMLRSAREQGFRQNNQMHGKIKRFGQNEQPLAREQALTQNDPTLARDRIFRQNGPLPSREQLFRRNNPLLQKEHATRQNGPLIAETQMSIRKPTNPSLSGEQVFQQFNHRSSNINRSDVFVVSEQHNQDRGLSSGEVARMRVQDVFLQKKSKPRVVIAPPIGKTATSSLRGGLEAKETGGNQQTSPPRHFMNPRNHALRQMTDQRTTLENDFSGFHLNLTGIQQVKSSREAFGADFSNRPMNESLIRKHFARIMLERNLRFPSESIPRIFRQDFQKINTGDWNNSRHLHSVKNKTLRHPVFERPPERRIFSESHRAPSTLIRSLPKLTGLQFPERFSGLSSHLPIFPGNHDVFMEGINSHRLLSAPRKPNSFFGGRGRNKSSPFLRGKPSSLTVPVEFITAVDGNASSMTGKLSVPMGIILPRTIRVHLPDKRPRMVDFRVKFHIPHSFPLRMNFLRHP